MPEGIADNPPDRCYLCKRALYSRLIAVAEEAGFAPVLDGSNVDDLRDYRPGLRALGELGVESPFLGCGIGKADVRRIAHGLGLPTWRKPTNTCLLTRLPFGRRITMEGLQRIEEAERLLLDRGYDWVRVRAHGDLARIEVAPELRQRALDEAEDHHRGAGGIGLPLRDAGPARLPARQHEHPGLRGTAVRRGGSASPPAPGPSRCRSGRRGR